MIYEEAIILSTIHSCRLTKGSSFVAHIFHWIRTDFSTKFDPFFVLSPAAVMVQRPPTNDISEDFQFHLTSRELFAETNAPLVFLQHQIQVVGWTFTTRSKSDDVEGKWGYKAFQGKLFKRAKYFENAKPVSRWSVEYLSNIAHKIGIMCNNGYSRNQAGIVQFKSVTFPATRTFALTDFMLTQNIVICKLPSP